MKSFKYLKLQYVVFFVVLLIKFCYSIIDVLLLYQHGLLPIEGDDLKNSPQYIWQAASTYKLNSAFKDSKIRVHILGSASLVRNDINEIAGYEIINLEKFQNTNTIFQKVYKHRSILPIKYEYWCFLRWQIFYEYVQSRQDLNMSTIVIADTDVIIYEDLQVFVDRVINLADPEWKSVNDFDMVGIIHGALSVMTISGLAANALFLMKLYSMDNTDFDTYANQYGSKNLKEGKIHLSDMHTLSTFRAIHTRRRKYIGGVDLYNPNAKVAKIDLLKSNNSTLCTINCDPRKVITLHGFPMTKKGTKCCFLHFQGGKKALIKEFVRNITISHEKKDSLKI